MAEVELADRDTEEEAARETDELEGAAEPEHTELEDTEEPDGVNEPKDIEEFEDVVESELASERVLEGCCKEAKHRLNLVLGIMEHPFG